MTQSEQDWIDEVEAEDRKDPLRVKERLVFEIIKRKNGIVTMREIQDELGFSSTSVVSRYIQKLQIKGFIRKVTGYIINENME